MKHIQNDGGRADAGYDGSTNDCVVRSIAIATETPYSEVYDEIFSVAKAHGENKRDRVAKYIQRKGGSPRNGVHRPIYQKYLESRGWAWTPTMKIGQGCTVHLKADELPEGRLIVAVSKHVTAVMDGVIHDTHDPSRNGTRCVYGYFKKIN